MIITEHLDINGKDFIKTYSDKGMMVEREGVRYSEAIDPMEFNRVYTETDEPIDNAEATDEDYQSALTDLGVNFDA
jgi:hypothetical protein